MPTESKYFVSLFGLLGGLLTSSGLYAAVPAFSTQSPRCWATGIATELSLNSKAINLVWVIQVKWQAL